MPNHKPNYKKGERKYTNQELLTFIQNFRERHGRIPFESEFAKENGLPCGRLYYTYFGTLTEAIKQAGFKPNLIGIYGENEQTDEQLLDSLRKLAVRMGYVPSMNDSRPREEGVWRLRLYSRRFGSIANALRRAGIEPNPIRHELRRRLSILFRFAKWFSHILRERV